jgi:cytochrome c-type biogenesis protein CcmH
MSRAAPLRVIIVAALLALAAGAHAVQPSEVLKDPALEARARTLSGELRCMVCQNQSIDDSDATLAKDIRVLIRERIVAGQSNDEVRAFLVSRYGDFILLRPPFGLETLLLWGSAPLALLLGAIGVYFSARRARALPEAAPLSAGEEGRVAELASDPKS